MKSHMSQVYNENHVNKKHNDFQRFWVKERRHSETRSDEN